MEEAAKKDVEVINANDVEVVGKTENQNDWGSSVQELFVIMEKNHMDQQIDKLTEQMKSLDMTAYMIDKIMGEIESMKKRQDDMEDVFLELLSEIEGKANLSIELAERLQELEAEKNNMEKSYTELKKEQVSLKNAFKSKAASIVKSVKDKGVQALNRVCEFAKLGENCEKLRNKLLHQSAKADANIKKVTEADKLFREAIVNLRNAKRTMNEKELVALKDKGLFATRARVKSLNKIKSLALVAAVGLDNAVKKVAGLSQEAAEISERQAEKKRNKRKR